MTAIKSLKATARPRAGKGAARAERRAGRVPAVIYGDRKDPVTISLDFKEIRTRIYAGHFLTTIFDIDVDGTVHRVIPRDYALDPVRDTPVHVDFLRVGAGTKIRVEVPIHVMNQDKSPGLKRGGTVNIVEHALALLCPADSIPQSIDVDLTGLEINGSVHLSDVKLPEGVKAVAGEDVTLVTIVPSSGFREEARAAAGAAPAEAAKA